MRVLEELARRKREGTLVASAKMAPKRPPNYPPAPVEHVIAAERVLGFALPPLLREIYLTIGNGGFGPGYGLFAVDDGVPARVAKRDWYLVELYTSFRERPRRNPWGDKMLPICSWGCTYFSYLDCALPDAPVMSFDENSHGHGPWDCAFSLHAKSFEEWLTRWLSGEDMWQSIGLYGEPKFWFEENQVQG
jgi:hypothetical protein